MTNTGYSYYLDLNVTVYSEKLWREKNFANIAVLRISANVFSVVVEGSSKNTLDSVGGTSE